MNGRKACGCEPGATCINGSRLYTDVWLPEDQYCKIAEHDALREKAELMDWLEQVAPDVLEMYRKSYDWHNKQAEAIAQARKASNT